VQRATTWCGIRPPGTPPSEVCDLVIITADEKEDWWWRQQSALLGPRPELTSEYYNLGGHRLFLLRPPELLARAAVLDVEVDQQSLADAERPSEEADPVPWTADALLTLLARLDGEAPVQANVIRLAARSGGRVTRDQVYKLGGFPDDRMLRGFTRPPARITVALQAEGLVPDRILPILVARYPEGVKASYFSVPPVRRSRPYMRSFLRRRVALPRIIPESGRIEESSPADARRQGRQDREPQGDLIEAVEVR